MCPELFRHEDIVLKKMDKEHALMKITFQLGVCSQVDIHTDKYDKANQTVTATVQRVIRGGCDKHERLSLSDIQAKRQSCQNQSESDPCRQTVQSTELGVFHAMKKMQGVRDS